MLTYVLTTKVVQGTQVTYSKEPTRTIVSIVENPDRQTELILVYQGDFTPTEGTKLTLEEFMAKKAAWKIVAEDMAPSPPEIR